MSHVPHELTDEFPDQVTAIQTLRTGDRHFAKLADDYHEVNRLLHRIETRVEPASEERERELRRQRIALKDEIAAALAGARQETAP